MRRAVSSAGPTSVTAEPPTLMILCSAARQLSSEASAMWIWEKGTPTSRAHLNATSGLPSIFSPVSRITARPVPQYKSTYVALPDLEPTSFGWPAKYRCTGGDVDVSPLPRVPLLLSAVRRRPTPYTPVRRGRAGYCSRFVLQCILAIRNGKPRGCATCLALPCAYSPRRFPRAVRDSAHRQDDVCRPELGHDGGRAPAFAGHHVKEGRRRRPQSTMAQGGAKKRAVKKVVLAYSGGLDTSIILKWLQTTYRCEVVTFTADLGQGEEIAPAREKALLLGIKPHNIFIEDLREEFVRDYVFPMFRANALYEGQYLLGTSIARPLIAKRQIEIAEKVGADAVAHGATGKGNDQVRFELSYYALKPDVTVIAPWREWELRSREALIAFAEQHQI